MNVNLSDRFTWILVGVIIGCVLGYATRYLQERQTKHRSEAGSETWMQKRWAWFRSVRLKSWTLALVVLISVFASFQTQHVNNDLRKNDKADQIQQNQIENISRCNSDFLGKVLLALNERTTYSTDQADANVKLQEQQLALLTFAFTLPPPSASAGRIAFGKYIDRVKHFIELARKTADKTSTYPYPTLDEFSECVDAVDDKEKR